MNTRNNLVSVDKAISIPLKFDLRSILTLHPHVITVQNYPDLCLFHKVSVLQYIDDIMQIGPSEQEAAAILDLLTMHMHTSRWEINTSKFQGPSTSVKFLGSSGGGACSYIPSRVKDKSLPWTLPPLGMKNKDV